MPLLLLWGLLDRTWKAVSDLKSLSFWCSLGAYAICSVIEIQFDSYLDAGDGRTSPDLCFGYTIDDMQSLLEGWGPERCRWYATVVGRFDLFPYIPAYVILVGGLLRSAYAAAGSLSHFYYKQQILVMALFDYVETITQIYLAQSYPSLNPSLVALGSTANMLKWTSFGVIVLQIIGGFVLGSMKQKGHEKRE